MNLWDLYLSDEKYHYHCSNNIFENTFNDALSMQGERDCSVEECSKLIEAAQMLAADLGIIVRYGE